MPGQRLSLHCCPIVTGTWHMPVQFCEILVNWATTKMHEVWFGVCATPTATKCERIAPCANTEREIHMCIFTRNHFYITYQYIIYSCRTYVHIHTRIVCKICEMENCTEATIIVREYTYSIRDEPANECSVCSVRMCVCVMRVICARAHAYAQLHAHECAL